MTTSIKISFLFFATLIINCNVPTNKSNETISQVEKTIPIRKNYNGENNKIFVFVGEKISVEQKQQRQPSFDNAYIAKYLIVKKVFGEFLHDTIEFIAYDHYGIPPFSEFKNVLLFVSADSGFYYHQKYMYNDVYLTKNGKWAGAYAEEDYGHDYNKHTKIKPLIIDFVEPIFYPIKIIRSDSEVLTINYPKKYYKTIKEKAYPIYGNYVEELFILKRDGYLTAREIFKNGKLID
jgi:hypothetical protein